MNADEGYGAEGGLLPPLGRGRGWLNFVGLKFARNLSNSRLPKSCSSFYMKEALL